MIITEYLAENIKIKIHEYVVNLDVKCQRELIAWFWRSKPELIRGIICEDCPEHIGVKK